MTASLSVQLYSLGGLTAADPAGVVARLASMGYAGVEPVIPTGMPQGLRDWAAGAGVDDGFASVDVALLKKALDDNGMVAHASHVHLPEGDAAVAVLDEQELLGSAVLVTPVLFDEERGALESFDDLDRIKRLAERFNRAAELARARGMRVGYHNHFWEFGTEFDGRTGLEVFFDLVEPDVIAEVDVYWAQVAGRDPAELVAGLGERVWSLHVKDGDGQPGTASCALGAGVVDLPAVLGAATAAAWHIVELEGLDETTVWPALDEAASHLVGGGFSTGRRP